MTSSIATTSLIDGSEAGSVVRSALSWIMTSLLSMGRNLFNGPLWLYNQLGRPKEICQPIRVVRCQDSIGDASTTSKSAMFQTEVSTPSPVNPSNTRLQFSLNDILANVPWFAQRSALEKSARTFGHRERRAPVCFNRCNVNGQNRRSHSRNALRACSQRLSQLLPIYTMPVVTSRRCYEYCILHSLHDRTKLKWACTKLSWTDTCGHAPSLVIRLSVHLLRYVNFQIEACVEPRRLKGPHLAGGKKYLLVSAEWLQHSRLNCCRSILFAILRLPRFLSGSNLTEHSFRTLSLPSVNFGWIVDFRVRLQRNAFA